MRYREYMQYEKYLNVNVSDLQEILNERPIEMWAYCIHDKDTYEDGTLKEKHIHIMMKFKSDQTPDNICKWFDDKPQYIQKNKHQYYAYENMCSYLVHETPTEDGKYHYSDDEVTANFDFHEYMEVIRHNVKERKNKVKYRKEHPLKDVLIKISNNEIPRMKIDNYIQTMDRIKYNKDIEQAYKIRDERLAKMIDREMKVLYFYGASGTGKTTFAKLMGKSMGYDIFVTGSSNDPLQGYIGQECIILDDIRGSDWKINDLLKLLDNNTVSLAKSRYSNKLMNDCKLMILTSVQDVHELYATLQQTDNEPISQLERRCSVKCKFTIDTIEQFEYSEDEKGYIFKASQPNPIKAYQFIKENKSLLQNMNNLINAMNEDINGGMPF